MAHEFLTQFSFSVDIDVSRRELEVTRKMPNKSISSFVSRWRAKVVGMIDWSPKEQDYIDMVLTNLQPRFSKRLMGIPFQDLKSLVHAISVEESIARGLWTYTTPSPNIKGKKPVGSSNRSGEVDTISCQHQRPTHHSPYRPPTIKAHFSHP